ncbi:DUF6318 family protein [Arthrobacter russicus]|uniref:DUF6318 domain-containing protein n=1 Tax=Arthrobacter russicus TaxID=172040 RepID=A0ABU1JFW6_9MICC|nr:DUF6318 family protein [Arthrobacter russicus]MDN5667127.1 DUF6318 family protein [Renibacterium salmoninarum]MDR6270272.1 hypothetical protein [Arthrobacter russicus]
MVLTKVFRFTAVAGLLLGASACTGAGGAPSSSTSPPSASASSSSASPTPTAAYKPADANGPAENVPKPEKPALADEFSEQGLDAFTRYWYAAYNYMQETGDISLVQAVTEQSCARCNNVISSASDWYKNKNWVVGGLITVDATKVSFVKASNGAYQVLIQYGIGEGQYIKADKTLGDKIDKTVANGDVLNAVHNGNQWVVTDIGKAG